MYAQKAFSWHIYFGYFHTALAFISEPVYIDACKVHAQFRIACPHF